MKRIFVVMAVIFMACMFSLGCDNRQSPAGSEGSTEATTSEAIGKMDLYFEKEAYNSKEENIKFFVENKGEEYISFGRDYRFQHKQDGRWNKIKLEGYNYTDDGIVVRQGNTFEMDFELFQYTGELESGDYRFGIPASGANDDDMSWVYAELKIENN